jgi:hypothetical protein
VCAAITSGLALLPAKVQRLPSSIRLKSASGLSQADYRAQRGCENTTSGTFAQLEYQVLDQDGLPLGVADLEVQEFLSDEYTLEISPFGGQRRLPTSGSRDATDDTNWNSVIKGGVSLTTPAGTFYDRPFGGCGDGFALHGGYQAFRIRWEGGWIQIGQQNFTMSLFPGYLAIFGAAPATSYPGINAPGVPSWTWNNFPR